MRRLAPAAVVLVLAAGASLGATSASAPPSLEDLLMAAETPVDLRSRMHVHAAQLGRDRPDLAAQALRYAARSYERSGLRDSAILELRGIAALRDDASDQRTLAVLLLRRREPGDVAAATALLEKVRAKGFEDREALLHTTGLLAWARSLDSKPDSAYALLRPIAPQLLRNPDWRYRVAKILVDAGRFQEAYKAVSPLAIEARLQDAEVAAIVRAVGEGFRAGERVTTDLERQVLEGDREELQTLTAMGGRRVRFFAPDGFGLGGVIAAPGDAARHPSLVVLANPGEPIARYDSLVTGLRAAGIATIVLDVRGSGWSVALSCPLMETWEGRQESMRSQVAQDVGVAWRHLAASARVDTTRYAIMGIGTAAPIAAEAAALDPRVAALVLVSPRCESVERGPFRARIAARPLPLFIELSPEDSQDPGLSEALFQAGDRGTSRMVDGRGPVGAILFQRDPDEIPRITQWLEESLRPARRGPRPPSRRGG